MPSRYPVFLIGYRATGKTSVGKALASRLACDFLDTDRAVESAAGASISELFQKHGEAAFRSLETRALQTLVAECANRPRRVIATGGGIILAAENREALRENGTVVWLAADVDTICRRLSADQQTAATRPPLKGKSVTEEVKDVLEARLALYEETAHVTVDTEEKTVAAIVEEILGRLGLGSA